MTVELRPSAARGVVTAPPSKSMAHRALICAALSGGVSTIRGVTDSQDMLATMDCLRLLGAQIAQQDQTAVVTGTGGAIRLSDAPLPCRDSGSTLRFLIPLALLTDNDFCFTGSNRLFARPLTVYAELCRRQGLGFRQTGSSLAVRGPLRAGAYAVAGHISSQFISGLLFALPLLDGDSHIHLLPPVESRPYISMTAAVLSDFGVKADVRENEIRIRGGQRYAPRDFTVEGDWSNAAFFDALGLLGGNVRVTGLCADSLQGDRIYPRYFEAIRRGCPCLDLADCPDLGPVCMALAACFHGADFTGVRRLRDKESDRCAAMAQELAKFGVKVDCGDDTVSVRPTDLRRPAAPLWGHNDHRIVMALSLPAARTGGVIDGAEAVDKSMPDFFVRLQALGVDLTVKAGHTK